jgi:2-amino-4-hydroxy-6-hydroxymethyldihydropteridine diphosphokinase
MKSSFVAIGVGSNIRPEENVRRAKQEVAKVCTVVAESTFRYTKPLLYEQQSDFLNGCLLVSSHLDIDSLKKRLKEIERKLGRVRGPNKNGPRTIDLDILVYDGRIVDGDIYERSFLREAIVELLPDFGSQIGEPSRTRY